MILLLSFCIFLSASASNVKELTKDDFDSHLSSHNSLVMFYAPWCGHCKSLKPIFEEVANHFNKIGTNNVLARIDCDANSEKCKEFEVSGYPTLKVFKNGIVDESFTDIPRDKGGLIRMVDEFSSPDYIQISKKDDIGLEKEYQLVGYCESDKDCEKIKKLCQKIRSYIKCGIADATLSKEMDMSGKIVLYQPKDLHNKFYPNAFTSDITDVKKMEQFVEDHYPAFGDLRTHMKMKYFKDPICVAYYYMDFENNPKNSNFWRNRILRALHTNKFDNKDLSVAVSSIIEFAHELDGFGFSTPTEQEATPESFKDKPKIGCFKDGKKYPMSEEFTEEAFAKFLKKFLSGKLTPHVKSEPIPTEDDGEVKVVVGSTFNDIVMKKDRDVLVEFYAPWCGHCKSLAPKYKEVAEKLKDDQDTVILAKVDATANDFPPSFEVKGYPTLFWVPKNGKSDKPIPFNGGREVDSIIEFIAKHSSKELTKYDRKGKLRKGFTETAEKDAEKSEL